MMCEACTSAAQDEHFREHAKHAAAHKHGSDEKCTKFRKAPQQPFGLTRQLSANSEPHPSPKPTLKLVLMRNSHRLRLYANTCVMSAPCRQTHAQVDGRSADLGIQLRGCQSGGGDTRGHGRDHRDRAQIGVGGGVGPHNLRVDVGCTVRRPPWRWVEAGLRWSREDGQQSG